MKDILNIYLKRISSKILNNSYTFSQLTLSKKCIIYIVDGKIQFCLDKGNCEGNAIGLTPVEVQLLLNPSSSVCEMTQINLSLSIRGLGGSMVDLCQSERLQFNTSVMVIAHQEFPINQTRKPSAMVRACVGWHGTRVYPHCLFDPFNSSILLNY